MKIVLYKPGIIRKGVEVKAIYSSTTGTLILGTDFQRGPDGSIRYFNGRTRHSNGEDALMLMHRSDNGIYRPKTEEALYVAVTDIWVDIFTDLTCIGEFGGDEVFGMGQITSIVDKYEEQLKLRKRDRELSKALKEIEETEF